MIQQQMKQIRTVHVYLRAFACVLFLLAVAETLALVRFFDAFGLVLWGVAAQAASAWIVYRMDWHVKQMDRLIAALPNRIKLYEALDAAFEKKLEKEFHYIPAKGKRAA